MDHTLFSVWRPTPQGHWEIEENLPASLPSKPWDLQGCRMGEFYDGRGRKIMLEEPDDSSGPKHRPGDQTSHMTSLRVEPSQPQMGQWESMLQKVTQRKKGLQSVWSCHQAHLAPDCIRCPVGAMDIRGKHVAQKIPQRQEEEWVAAKTNVHTPTRTKPSLLTRPNGSSVSGPSLGVHPHQLQDKAQLLSLASKLFPGWPTACQNDTVMKKHSSEPSPGLPSFVNSESQNPHQKKEGIKISRWGSEVRIKWDNEGKTLWHSVRYV